MSKEENWPAWYYGPNGEAEIFESVDDVPEGWLDHPSKHETGEGIDADKLGNTAQPVPASEDGAGDEVDASGWEWDASRNRADKAKSATGLWLLKPGQSRPAPKPGYPKEPTKYNL